MTDGAVIKIVQLDQTCLACPSQWDAWDENGQYYYLRYRCGKGTMNAEPSPDTRTWRYDVTTEVVSWRYGDRLDGCITIEKFAELSGFELALEPNS